MVDHDAKDKVCEQALAGDPLNYVIMLSNPKGCQKQSPCDIDKDAIVCDNCKYYINPNYRSPKCQTCDKLRCGNCIYGPHRTNYPKTDNYSPAIKGKGGTIGGDGVIETVGDIKKDCDMCRNRNIMCRQCVHSPKRIKGPEDHYSV